MPLSPLLHRAQFDDLPAWRDDRHADAFAAFRLCAARQLSSPAYRAGALGIEPGRFSAAFAEAAALDIHDDDTARRFFESYFLPFRIQSGDADHGFVTGFYEPQVPASPVRTPEFGVPLLSVPDDLVKIDDDNRPLGLDPYLAFGRSTSGSIVEYHDRAAIETGAIEGKANPLAWLADPVDAFFIHVQGAARLLMPDGSVCRVTYAAKSGQRFTGAGRVLADMGEIPLQRVTMQSIRAWFRANPHRVSEILHRNRSYIFFRIAAVDNPALGPVAAAKVQLTAGRSMAVDRLLHTFATPFFVDAATLGDFDDPTRPFRRLMVAQDTGSAIIGPARGDLFTGSGDQAGEIAGVIRHPAAFYALVPREIAGHGQA